MIDPFAWLALLGIAGHVSWLLWLSNVLHARLMDQHKLKLITRALDTWLVGGAAVALVWAGVRIGSASGYALPELLQRLDLPLSPVWRTYVAVCVVNTVVGFVPWLVRRLTFREADVLLSDERRLLDLRKETKAPHVHSLRARLLTSIPGNQALQLAVHTKRLRIPRLPAALAGLRIAHLSDLHLTGELDRRIYEYFVELTHALEPDLIALTGDLVEKTPCWDWLPGTLGSLRAQYGTYFVLGNHDIRIDHERTRQVLVESGLVNLGAACRRIEIRGIDSLLAGNELPWLGPPPLPDPPLRPRNVESFRLLLAHTPDELPWARQYDFDLMLAGHVHGGQIQIPPLGPILAPSVHGAHYACGVFHEPPTVMHVGRGTSGKLPLRFFCPPELTLLVLEPEIAADGTS
ncbi:MAG: phosphoesterase [Pirellula sp.]|nr:phosphoesterase [Pirellula sp.]